jgi:hypothetical protein
MRLGGLSLVAMLGMLAPTMLPAPPAAAGDMSAPVVTTVVTGLNNPRGLDLHQGSLYVAEAGLGGDGPCGPGPLGKTCVGQTGSIDQVQGNQAVPLALLSSIASRDGSAAFGPHDVAVAGDGSVYGTIGLAGSPRSRRQFGPEGALLGHLVRTSGSGGVRDVADILHYEATHNPDGEAIESDPYGLLREHGYSILTDAAGNSLLKVTDDGDVSTLAVFRSRQVDFGGQQVPMDAVPTTVVRGPDGALYVGQLTGFPFPRGGARVFRVVPGQRPKVYARGFTNIIDMQFDHNGNLYVLEIAHNTLNARNPYGELLRMRPNGNTSVVLGKAQGLFFPTSVKLDGRRSLLVTDCGVCPGQGRVLRVGL